ncbi:MAG: hypothetical protein E7645_04420 [Ruminococcaceae bacterium]|nr:hypothetical protein [Oscillospiraceae bacterium]
MKKILVLLLSLVMVLSMFVACETPNVEGEKTEAPTEAPTEATPQSVMEAADQAMLSAPYKMTMKMAYSSDNAELNEVYKQMDMEIPMIVDGNNMSMDMSMEMEGITIKMLMTIVDKTLYYDMEIMGQSQKVKCSLTDKQLEDFMKENNAQLPVSPEEFGKISMEEKDGKFLISCDEITAEGTKMLNDLMAGSLGDVDLTIDDITFTMTIADNKYESMNMGTTCSMNIGDTKTSVTLDADVLFDYENVAPITAPEDADSYQEMSYDDLMGGQ